MRRTFPVLGTVVGMLAGLGLPGDLAKAQAQPPPVPPLVLAHMNDLDTRCRAAGGRPGQGRFVIAQDFTGDGRLDYLVSEGDYACTGRPALFRPGGEAKVDIYVANARGQVLRAWSDTLIAYRIVAGRPTRVQIARRGAACGAGVAPSAQCAAQLAWNGSTFGAAVSVGAGASSTPALTVASAGSATDPAAAMPAFLAKCRRGYIAREASATRWADQQCQGDWKRIIDTGSAAEALLAVLPAPGQRPTVADIRSRATGVRWAARPASARELVSGQIGGLSVAVEGRGASPASIGVSWMQVGAEIPYDVPGALRARGATITEVACEKLGVGEGNRTYAGAAPGKAPFVLTVDQRTAPTGNANSYYSASVSLDGRTAPRGSTAGCDF